MSSKASEEKLGELHGVMAQAMIDRVQSGEATAADLKVMVDFLKNNGITAQASKNPLLEALTQQVADMGLPTDADVDLH